MSSTDYVFQSDFALRNQAKGRAEGEVNALLMFLAARGIAVSDTVRERITACRDLAEIDKWITRAATADTVQELFAQ